MLRKVRILLALLVFLPLTWLFLDFTGAAQHHVAWLAKWQLLPAVLSLNAVVIVSLVVLTLLFGRIYCSVICPLGVLQDALAHLRPRKNKKVGRYSYSPEKKWLRYTVFVLFVLAIVAGVGSIVALLAPYSSYGRIAANLFKPVWLEGNNILANIAEKHDSYAFYHVDVWVRSLPTFIIAAATFLLLAILAWVGGRTYCNTLCPVGTALSFLSRFSFLKINFDEAKCRNCSACTKACKASCIDYKTHTVDYSRCVVCGNCIDKCKFGALKYDNPKLHPDSPPALPVREGAETFVNGQLTMGNNSGKVTAPSLTGRAGGESGAVGGEASRRTFLLASASVLGTAALAQSKAKMDGGLAAIEDKVAPKRQTPITPPGSLSAKNMASHCTGCQLCVAECPNEVLRPSADLMTLMQPVMSYEHGYCRTNCSRCSQVCPAGAIRPIGHDEKTSIQIGHAVWGKKNCVVLTDGVRCGNCARHCPVGAIQMVPLDPEDEHGLRVPAVNEAKCIGCGACENLCPARPFSAIYVEGHEVHKEI